MIKRRAGLFLAFCSLWIATAANAISFTDFGATANVVGTNTATLAYPGSLGVGTTVVAKGGMGSGVGAGDPAPTLTDTQGNVYTVDIACGQSAGQSQAWIAHSILTHAVTASDHITYTAAGGATPFGSFAAGSSPNILAPDGAPACTSIASGAATASGPSTSVVSGIAVGVGVVNNPSGANYTAQAAGFTSSPATLNWGAYGPLTSAYQIYSGVQTLNYNPASAVQTTWSSAALVLYRTAAVPFNPKSGNLLGIGPGSAVQNATGCQGAPDVAVANNLCLQTFGTSFFSPSLPYTVDQAVSYIGGARLYYYNGGQTAQPSNTTLQGSSALVGENSGNFQGTLSTMAPGNRGGTSFVGKEFGPDPNGTYFESTCSFTASNQNTTTWQACAWAYTAECLTVTIGSNCQWPGQTQPYYVGVEPDIMEMFMGAFSTTVNDFFSSSLFHYGNPVTTNLLSTQFKTSPGSASFSSLHRYGMLWTPSTDTTLGSLKYYYDGTLEGTQSYSHFAFKANAAGSATSGVSTTVTTVAGPNSSAIVTPYMVQDITAGCIPGTVSTWVGTTLTFTGAVSCSIAANDALVVAPPVPPAVSSATYNSATGVITAVMASNPGYAIGVSPTFIVTSGTGATANISGTYPTIAGTTGTTVVLQGPTGQGTITISAATMNPQWLFGVIDMGHQNFLTGCMNSPDQCLLTNMSVWQSTDNFNVTSY